MKKTLLILSAFCFSIIIASAQITITTADVATPVTAVYQANDTLPTISVGTPGTNQTWNMSALATDYTDTLTFEPYSFAPDATFGTANLLVKQGYQNNFAYAINSALNLKIIGNVGTVNLLGYPTVVSQTVVPAEKLATFSFTYNTSFNQTYRTHAKFYFGHSIMVGTTSYQVDSIRDHSTVVKTVTVDAWGTLTTPLGTYNVIRSKETKVTDDTTDAYVIIFPPFGAWQNAINTTHDSITTYTWWANGLGYSLATATLDTLGNVQSVQWLMQAPVVTGVNQYTSAISEIVYPNPAQDKINFVADAATQKAIQVYDVTGRLIEIIAITNNQTTVNTSEYAKGMYSFSIIGKDNTIINRGKFTINK